VPPLQAQTPPPSSNDDEEVRSPGGGSIRTVGGDILSGILAHTDDDDDDSNAIPSKEELLAKTEATDGKAIPLEPAAEVSPGKGAKALSKSFEDDEEMGEIPLDKTTTATHNPEPESKDEQPKAEVEKKEGEDAKQEDIGHQEEPNADGTKSEEIASGVV